MKIPVSPARAFTLVELIIVIAILAILAAVLFPVLAKSREKARLSTCSSNLRQISVGILQYAQDSGEKMVPQTMGGKEWTQIMQPYFKDQSIFQCPSNPRSTEKYAGAGVGFAGYASNFQGGFRQVDATYPPMSMSDYKSPSQTIGVLESTARYSGFNIDAICPGQYCSQPSPSTDNGCLFMGHEGGMTNYLFMDGHVKAYKPLDTLDKTDGGTNNINLWRYDNDTFVHWQSLQAEQSLGPAEPTPTRPIQLINICTNPPASK